MVRRHGWQLPAHPFQIVAITVFLLLIVAFYVFLFPFLGNPIAEYIAVGIYSPVAIAALLLYFRCTAIDPSDPGILEKSSQKSANGFQKSDAPKSPQGLSASARSSSVAPSDFESKVAWAEEGRQQTVQKEVNRNTHAWGALICGLLVHPDNCRDDQQENPQSTADDEALFCTLCNAEVRKFSKHCRNCDKCVDGFDHHCRWLNNCVGRKNYTTFILLMATSLLLLLLDCSTGVAVMVRCFVDKKNVDEEIVEKLGNGFSRIPFATIVAICTFVSLLALLPLGELFFFHLILIKKGITTYEYVVAMRAQNESQGGLDREHQSIPSSPTSSAATGLSGSSSIGLQYRGAWCTPPRIFVEHQDEVIPHLAPGRVPSTVDPDAGKAEGKIQRQQVRISAWKLAKLNREEATRAAAKAREKSSVLRPLKGPESTIPDTDFTSSMSSSSMSTDFGVTVTGHIGAQKDPVQPIQYLPQRHMYSLGSKTESDTRTQSSYSSPSRTSMNESNGASPLSIQDRLGVLHVPPSQQRHHNQAIRQDMFRPTSTKYFASKGELGVYPPYGSMAAAAADELIKSKASHINRNLRESKRTAVFWDGTVRRPRAMIGIADPNNILRGEPSQPAIQSISRNDSTHSSSGDLTNTASDNILYSGASIFFGGPLCPPVSVQKDKTNASATNNNDNVSRLHGQDTRSFEAQFSQPELPVFAPHFKK